MGAGGAMDPTIPLAPVRAFAEPPGVDDATALLAAAPLDAIGFGFTSSAYVLGPAGEQAMLTRLAGLAAGIPVVAPCTAALAALVGLGVNRVAVLSPPWFDAQLVDLSRRFYADAGFHVVLAAACGLPSDQKLVTPGALHDWAVANVPDSAEAVTIGGNGFRAIGVVDALEASLGRPVLTANQLLLWALLSAAGAGPERVQGYGRLFGLPAAP